MKQIIAALMAGSVLFSASAMAQTALTRTADPNAYDPNDIFGTVDQNNDDQLNLAEYSAYIDRYAQAGDVTSINIRNNEGYEGVFRHYDKNRDGLLSRDELGKASRINLDSTLAT